MRVISGTAKGRRLKSPGTATRPITDRVKENLFNILGARVLDANVLDLFAGAGSVGIEALSRGARSATFVEVDRNALRALRENLTLTRLADRAKIVRLDVFKFIRQGGLANVRRLGSTEVVTHGKGERSRQEEYDLIYIAPPQYRGLWAETLEALDGREFLTKKGIVVAQIHPKEYRALKLETLRMTDQRKYGSTLLCFYQLLN